MKKITVALLTVVCFFIGNTCFAYDASQISTINTVDASYMPRKVYFSTNNQPSLCGWFTRSPSGDTAEEQNESVKAAYQGLMTALISGRSVKIYYSFISGSNNCAVDYIHFK